MGHSGSFSFSHFSFIVFICSDIVPVPCSWYLCVCPPPHFFFSPFFHQSPFLLFRSVFLCKWPNTLISRALLGRKSSNEWPPRGQIKEGREEKKDNWTAGVDRPIVDMRADDRDMISREWEWGEWRTSLICTLNEFWLVTSLSLKWSF